MSKFYSYPQQYKIKPVFLPYINCYVSLQHTFQLEVLLLDLKSIFNNFCIIVKLVILDSAFFLYLGSKVASRGDCEAAVTARMRSVWAKFKEWRDISLSKSSLLKIKGRVYASCVRKALLFGSEVWFLRQNELDILKRTEKAIVRAICGMKFSDSFESKFLIDSLGLKIFRDIS